MIEIGSALDPGRKRIAGENQDNLCVAWRAADPAFGPLLVIADGMGGYEGGAVASKMVTHSFHNVYQSADLSPLKTLQSGVQELQAALKQHAAHIPGLARMGSTVIATIIQDSKIYLLNVGDSRAYLIHAGRMRQISYDHSLVAEQVRQCLLTPTEARTDLLRNILSMAISAAREQVDTFSGIFDWQPGDLLVLCSDGLWGPVSDEAIQAAVVGSSPQAAADQLIALANANEGPDNISVIVARITETSSAAPRADAPQ